MKGVRCCMNLKQAMCSNLSRGCTASPHHSVRKRALEEKHVLPVRGQSVNGAQYHMCVLVSE